MLYDFKFAGTSLSDFYGVTTKRPDIEVAEYDGELGSTPGKSGDEFRDNKRYRNVLMKRSIGFDRMPGDNEQVMVRQLIGWLAYCKGYQEFEDSDHPGFVTHAVLINFDRVQIQLQRYHFATLQFSRMPFWFQKTGLNETEYTKAQASAGISFNNLFPIISQPLIKIKLEVFQSTSSPIISIDLNGVTLYYEYRRAANDQSSFIIDTESLQAYIEDDLGNIQLVDVDVPENLVFTPGRNTLQLLNTSNVNKLYVTPRWRKL